MRWLMNLMLDGPGGARAIAVADDTALLAGALPRAREVLAPRPGRVSFTVPTWLDGNDPAQAGWMLIVSDDDEGRAIARALAPLVEHRLLPRRHNPRVRVRRPEAAIKYFPPAIAGDSIQLTKWVAREIVFPSDDEDDGDDARPPEYVLVAGPPAKIPFELDHMLRLRLQCPGRLAFPAIEPYASYAAKVIAWEPDDDFDVAARTGLPVGLFATDHGWKDATHVSRQSLMQPIQAWLKRDKDQVHPALIDCLGEDARRDALLGLLRGDGEMAALAGPRLLFSATHGLAVRDDETARRARQGAIFCQDGSRYRDGRDILTAAAAGDGALLRGGIWVMFACFGAGTPARSQFFRALGDPALLGLHDGGPFLAALPTQLLANPDGPLGILGHLDPSFIHAFSDPDTGKGERALALRSILRNLLLGTRLGGCVWELPAAANMFGETLRMANETVAQQLARQPSDADIALALAQAEAGSPLGALRQQVVQCTVSLLDFRNFMVLGDPAVKLPRAGADKQGATHPVHVVPPAAPGPGVRASATTAANQAALPAAIRDAHAAGRVKLTCLEDIFSAQGVDLPPGEAVVVTLLAEPCADVRDRPSLVEDETGAKQPFFEAAEHQDCDLAAVLRFSATEAYPAPHYKLPLQNGVQLRYGELISLAGDFYGIPGAQVASGAATFHEVFASLDRGDANELCRILDVMANERTAVQGALDVGASVATAYARVGDDLNNRYNQATGGGCGITPLLPRGRYLALAGVNYDHFGADALAAYRVAHQEACAEALAARNEASAEARRDRLARAYAMNACGDHFLTDLFASGHLRVPRHALAEQISVKLVGDLLAKRMHDEDNARGLRVRNARGDEWTTYGDKHFNDSENQAGRALAREAVRRSVDEVWLAHAEARPPAWTALEVVPDLADALTRRDNHAALFILDQGKLKRRARLDDLACYEWTEQYTGMATLLRAPADPSVPKHQHGG